MQFNLRLRARYRRGQQHRKFIAANPGDQIGFDERLAKMFGKVDETGVTSGVTPPIIDQLEVINVKQD